MVTIKRVAQGKLGNQAIENEFNNIIRQMQKALNDLELRLTDTANSGYNPEIQTTGIIINGGVCGEVPSVVESSIVPGSTIRTAYKFKPKTVKLFRNGIRQTIDDDYTEDNSQEISIDIPLGDDENLLIDYEIL